MAGRRPKPTALKKLAGNPGKRPLNNAEPKYPPVSSHAPRFLDAEGRRMWRKMLNELSAARVLTRVDEAMLAVFCQTWATYVSAVKRLREEGDIIVTEKGSVYKHPLVMIRDTAADQLRKFAVEFGLTPSSRSRIKVGAVDEVDELERALFGQDVRVADG